MVDEKTRAAVNPKLSRRTAWELDETPYAKAVREARSGGGRLLDLTVSNPTQCGFSYDAKALLDPLIHPDALIYDPQPLGLRHTREAVSRYYAAHGCVVLPEQLVMTASTSESYSFLFRLLCDPGDEVLIAQPSYPLFDFLAALDDVVLRPYPLFHDHGWWIDFAELEHRITERTRAIVAVHPNNPTGHWTRAAERRRLEEVCAERGPALIVDEVFLDYGLDDGQPGETFAVGPHPALTFVLSGLSKIAGLPQMKAAWIAVLGPERMQAGAMGRLEVIADTFLSVSAPVQHAVPEWLAGCGAIQEQIKARVLENLNTLEQFAQEHPGRLRLLRPEAGWAGVISLPACGGDNACAERLVREHGIVVHPGSFYGMAEPNRAVVSLLVQPEVVRACTRVWLEGTG